MLSRNADFRDTLCSHWSDRVPHFTHKPHLRAIGRTSGVRVRIRHCRLGRYRRTGAGAHGDEREVVQEELRVEIREVEQRPLAPQRLHERRVLARRVAESRQRGNERLAAAAVALTHRAAAPHAPSIGTGRGRGRGSRRRGRGGRGGHSVGRVDFVGVGVTPNWWRKGGRTGKRRGRRRGVRDRGGGARQSDHCIITCS